MIPVNIVFYLCLLSHIVAASNAPIQDCDETFNYWEPLHYLTHGRGLQTWEYSPEFSIRSWAYVFLHALPVKTVSLVGRGKIFEFYSLRCLLAGVCAAANTRLYSVISYSLHPRIGVFYIMIAAFTPGFFYASAAFLPSSFAMITGTFGLAAFVEGRNGKNTSSAIMWFGMGAILGWPFAGALVLPFIIRDLLLVVSGKDSIRNSARQYLNGISRCLGILILQVFVDSLFYRKLAVVSWRLVVYNIFSGEDRGPDIFGTEPWHYYVRNLLLNFNLWFLLAIIIGPLLLLQAVFSDGSKKQSLLMHLTLISPFYLWLTIFTLQPHKEERFMFPAYPFLALNAAMSFDLIVSFVSKTDQMRFIGRIPPQLKTAIILPIVLASLNLGLLRILGIVTAYQAPLQIYDSLNNISALQIDSNICFGKDWYRFPTSFFLPGNIHPKFIKSEFDGLLPGEFLESNTTWFPGTWTTPNGMNDLNQEDMGKYVNIKDCSFLVDSWFPSTTSTQLELDFSKHQDWKQVKCVPFLDNASTGLLPRMIWIPDFSFIPARFRRTWGKHCLLQRT